MTRHACFLGVDGGGTKTRFALIDAAGRLLAQAQLGTAYYPQIGLEAVRTMLAQGVAQVFDDAGMDPQALGHAFFGLPAHGEDSTVTPLLDRMPAQILGHARYTCDNDTVCGWAGSLACTDGINIVAGTGSIGYGQRRGMAARAGGWGEAFSDEGSAHWIAVQGLNAYSRMSDGRLPKGPLHALVNDALSLRHDLDLCARIYGEHASTRSEVAQLSILVTRAAEAGDPVAHAIFARAGRELAEIAEAIRLALHFADDEDVPLSFSGGAFSAGELLLAPFRDALRAFHPRFDLRAPRHDPHYGAALYAAKLAGVAVPAGARA
ncbi:N-acetylglucosamine kinase [Pseudomonas sp. Hp2]|uniref:N-acetylglucosamine kinase n=1 Tax=Pseudomonas sp. Hp2 TaxID=701189 RepID=UPI001127AFA4|nr:BadF/BadG/BcrA/BcrD ATPase family protein [Pseudomonas sp. Hp2]